MVSTTTNYSQVKDLIRWTFCKRKSPFSFTSNCRNPQWISHTTATLVVSTCVCLPAKRHWPWHLAKKQKNLQKAQRRPTFCLVFILVVSSRFCRINCYHCTFRAKVREIYSCLALVLESCLRIHGTAMESKTRERLRLSKPALVTVVSVFPLSLHWPW